MKRLLFIITVAIAAVAFKASAQAEATDTRPMWGIKAAVDLNLPGKWHGEAGNVTMYRHGFGATVGAVCNIYLGRNFYLEPGASLFYDTYFYKDFVIAAPDPASSGISDPSIYKVGLRVPVVAGYSLNVTDRFAMSVFTGPELSYAFAGDIRVKDSEKEFLQGFSLFGDGGYQRRIDCAWKVGLGFPAGNWLVSIDASFGLTDLLTTGMSFRENRCSVSLTRYF